MPLPAFLLEAVLISLSGVMSHGPITAVTIGKGSDSPHAGAIVAAGHGIVEFPLMIAIYYGFGQLLNLSYVKSAIGLVGGLFLLYMGISMFLSIKETVERIIECGDYSKGMARIKCTNPHCGHEYFRPFVASLNYACIPVWF
ncbi:MAG: LysE family transporter [Spirochaetes bacterium]|nr:LysE family transporter [Spirochaetota bacterium]MCK5571064.1 LysE family transporter [Spirochaetota bacterium]